MADKKDLPTYEEITKWTHDMPKSIAERLPDCIEKREVERLLPVIRDLAYHAREQAPRE